MVVVFGLNLLVSISSFKDTQVLHGDIPQNTRELTLKVRKYIVQYRTEIYICTVKLKASKVPYP